MRRASWPKWSLIGGTGVAVVTALALLLAPRPVEVDVGHVRVGPIADSLSDRGLARVREAYVVSAPVSGRMERVDLHVGDRVAAGQTLVARIRPVSPELLDPRSRAMAEAAVAAANAAVRSGEAEQEQLAAQARTLESDLQRVRALAERGFAAAQALENAEAKARAARAAVRAAAAQTAVRRSERAAARANLIGPEAVSRGAFPVTSPASGFVTRVLQESERIVPVGAPLVEIGDQGGLEAAIEFLSQDAVRIREGMPAEIFDWGGSPIPALVRRVEPQGFTKISALGIEEQRVLVLLQFTGDPKLWGTLGPGYRLSGRVFLRREAAAVTVPLGALVRSDGGWAAFRVTEGRAHLTPIEVGAITEREAEVRRGLAAGDQVVVFPSDRIVDGVAVKVRKSSDG